MDTGIFYFLVSTATDTIACEVKTHIAEELLQSNAHVDLGVDEKTGIQEFEFLESR